MAEEESSIKERIEKNWTLFRAASWEALKW